MTRLLLAAALLVLATALPTAVLAGVIPCNDESTIPNCISVDPGGLSEILVEVRDCSGLPLGGHAVRVIFSEACSDDSALPFEGLAEDVGGSCQSPLVLEGMSDEDTATISFWPTIGGCCETNRAVRVEADPDAVTLLPVYDRVSSTDWSYCSSAGRSYADGQVNLSDFSAFTGEFLGAPANTCYDYPTGAAEVCDGAVNLSDFGFFQARFLSGDGDCPPCQ